MLYDRARELAALDAELARLRTGGHGLTVVVGALGIGRSALLDAGAKHAAVQGFTVVRARGSRLEQGLRHGLVRQIVGAGGELPRPVRTAAGPLAVFVDDLQWADEASLAWLRQQLDGADPAPLLVVAAVCEGESAADLPQVQDLISAADRVVRPRPLAADAVRAMVRERGVELAESDGREWAAATGGNPALVASLLDRLTGSAAQLPEPAGLLAAAASRPAPWSLRARIAAVLNSHPEPVRNLAYGAAIMDAAADLRLAARLVGLDPAEEASAAQVLRRFGWAADRREPPVLWHCVREIAEDGGGLAVRNELNRRATALLYAAGHPVESVTAHLLEISLGIYPEAVAVLREAAGAARRRGDPDLAVRCLRRALRELPPDSPQRSGLLAELADAEESRGDPAAPRHLAQASSLPRSAGARAAVAARAPLAHFLSAPRAAREVIETARAQLATADGLGATADEPSLSLRLEARARLCELGDPGAPAAAAARLRELPPGPGQWTAAQRELAAVLAFAGTLGGRLTAAEAGLLVRRLLEHEPATRAFADSAAWLLAVVGTAAEVGEPVRGWLDVALETARRRGDVRDLIRMLSARAVAARRAGLLADAWQDVREACELAGGGLDANDWPAAVGLVSVAIETADPRLAARVLAVTAGQPGTAVPVLQVARLALQDAAAAAPAPGTLATDLVEAVHEVVDAEWHNPALFPVARWSAAALMRLGAARTALELIAGECDRARAWGSAATLGETLRAWGTLLSGHTRYSLSLLAESVAVLRDCPNALELGRSLTAYGTRLRAAGRPGAAEALAEAEAVAAALGTSPLRWWAQRGDRSAAGSELDPDGGEALSGTERRVAALVALGHINQDIAAELDVTRRAVEKTLTGLYRRFGVSGRAELIPVVQRIAGRDAVRSGTV